MSQIASRKYQFCLRLRLASQLLACGLSAGAFAADEVPAAASCPPRDVPCAAAPATSSSAPVEASGEDGQSDRWNVHFQSTYVWQQKEAFHAPYKGPQSLETERERGYSLSLTAFVGLRLWNGGEFYVHPEGFEGVPFSHLYGLASIQNGELQKNGGPEFKTYWARAFLRQTIDLGGESFHVDDGANQLASDYTKQRVVLTLGRISLPDIFEKSRYANDPRSQFMNWALITHGAWDFAADARSYTVGAAAEVYWNDWAIRGGRFMEPTVANGTRLDFNIMRHHGDQIEVEHTHSIKGLPGSFRVLVFRNEADAGSYRDAINAALASGGVPDVTSVRKDAAKHGIGVSFDQGVTADTAVFIRASYADDKVEEYAFTEIDNTVSAGASTNGSAWERPDDTVGFAFASSGLNKDHLDYLAAGGLGGFLGDGQLTHYGRERVLEAYYNWQVRKGAWLTFDLQQIVNPGYNADRRGPVNVFGGRLHVEL
ncbi:carbohydrate porin [Ramlibacter aquaticus]|uniref:Carbohydrate porin n=1 Tax=Ramlibacter aquaticus TaxID=2780094 RepID=A0ABR9SD39_9BURK|nr:carbohydrate porin [Ramlibacter aquaticus]MBE7940139.1 carbohydrate porin [Ramlibacter aquaticus]